MTTENTNTNQGNALFQRRLTAYSTLAVAGACAVAAAPNSAHADIKYSGPLSLSVTVSSTGSFFNMTDFTFGTKTAAQEGNTNSPVVNLWGTGSTYAWFYPTTSTINRFAGTTTSVQDLTLGTPIGSTTPFGNTTEPSALSTTGLWVAGTTGYIGVVFSDPAKGTEYGWLQIMYPGVPTAANPIKILGAAYDNTGGTILAGAVPEPGTTAALAMGAVGLGAAAWRRRKVA